MIMILELGIGSMFHAESSCYRVRDSKTRLEERPGCLLRHQVEIFYSQSFGLLTVIEVAVGRMFLYFTRIPFTKGGC